MKKRIRLMIAAAAMLICMLMTSIGVSAAPSVLNDGKFDMTLVYHAKKSSNDLPDDYAVFRKTTANTTVKKLKSSKPSVATVSWSSTNRSVLHFNLKKPGKTKITGVLYEGKKKIKKFTINLTVRKYTNPAKMFKLNGTNYASKFKSLDTYTIKPGSTTKFKVKVLPKKGWKFEGLWYRNQNKTVEIDNKSTFTLMSNWSYVDAVFTNKKTGTREDIAIIIDK
ncbi:MAG: hypothetical protein IJI10_06790 [Eubacterium sp.]|nr:hypothetical protein [Eubacterium sp.]